MENFANLSNEEKRNFLNDHLDKEVSMIYSGCDLPTGKIGPTRIAGKITAVQVSSFNFKFDLNSEVTTLTISGIEEIQILE